MDFKDQIKQLSERILKLRDNILTEEATKNAFVLPFIQILGYDVFNPVEVVPEFTCDVGIKKGEKIDFAIMRDNEPILLIECKHIDQDIKLHDNQLIRYFHASSAKFGVMTNGIKYRFYTDLDAPNKMDEKPFFAFDMLDLTDEIIEELKKFHKSYFDVDNIFSTASELKYTRELKNVISNEFENPSPEFVKIVAKQVYDGVMTAKMLEQFTALVKKAITSNINETITGTLKSALTKEQKAEKAETEEHAITEEPVNKIITTAEEIEAFMIVKSILRQKIDVERILHKDTESYFAIYLDNIRKTICRLNFNVRKKYFATYDEARKETRHDIETLDDIYKYSDDLIKSLDKFEKPE